MNDYILPYNEILPAFCAVRNVGTYHYNGNVDELTPRLNFIIRLLNDLKLPYELDVWTIPNMRTGNGELNIYNIYLKGTSTKMVVAHHDVANHTVDNCNDNSASVINAIATKIANPEVHVAITDGEEFGGVGAHRLSVLINSGDFGQIDYVVNLELTAVGGRNFFTEPFPNSKLYEKVMENFPGTVTTRVPFHDGVIFRKFNIDSLVLNPLPLLPDGRLNFSLLSLCHSRHDSIALANYDDMDVFVKEVVTTLIK